MEEQKEGSVDMKRTEELLLSPDQFSGSAVWDRTLLCFHHIC